MKAGPEIAYHPLVGKMRRVREFSDGTCVHSSFAFANAGLPCCRFDCADDCVSALELKPFKDDLFAYPGILESKDNGDWIKVDYRKERDIYQRDTEPERKVKWQYVSMGVTWNQSFDTVDMGGRAQARDLHRRQGRQAEIQRGLHSCRGVDRKLGASDERFGGNFNRLKNLAVENGGVYVAPTVRVSMPPGLPIVEAVQSLSKTSAAIRSSSPAPQMDAGLPRDRARPAGRVGAFRHDPHERRARQPV